MLDHLMKRTHYCINTTCVIEYSYIIISVLLYEWQQKCYLTSLGTTKQNGYDVVVLIMKFKTHVFSLK